MAHARGRGRGFRVAEVDLCQLINIHSDGLGI